MGGGGSSYTNLDSDRLTKAVREAWKSRLPISTWSSPAIYLTCWLLITQGIPTEYVSGSMKPRHYFKMSLKSLSINCLAGQSPNIHMSMGLVISTRS